jgi:tRNA/tmRNA/rRNA uracil-C5-methylase (TrmA/RlmC/RlmD family)
MALKTELYESLYLIEMNKATLEFKDVIYITTNLSKIMSILKSLVQNSKYNKVNELEFSIDYVIKSFEEISIILIDISDNLEDMSLTDQIKTAIKFSSDISIVNSIQTRISDVINIISTEIIIINNTTESPNLNVLQRAFITINDKINAMKYAIIATKSDLALSSL